MTKVGCSHHCSGCHAHFSSLAAFDHHRFGGDCRDPATLPKLAPKTDAGHCGLQRIGERVSPVPVYALARDAQAWRLRRVGVPSDATERAA